jgi:histone H3/H4
MAQTHEPRILSRDVVNRICRDLGIARISRGARRLIQTMPMDEAREQLIRANRSRLVRGEGSVLHIKDIHSPIPDPTHEGITRAALMRLACRAGGIRMCGPARLYVTDLVNRQIVSMFQEARTRAAADGRHTLKIKDIPTTPTLPGAPRVFPHKPQDEPSARGDKKPCAICWDRAPCTVAVPCGHLYACATCASVRPKICALCRAPIQSMYRVYKQ